MAFDTHGCYSFYQEYVPYFFTPLHWTLALSNEGFGIKIPKLYSNLDIC